MDDVVVETEADKEDAAAAAVEVRFMRILRCCHCRASSSNIDVRFLPATARSTIDAIDTCSGVDSWETEG